MKLSKKLEKSIKNTRNRPALRTWVSEETLLACGISPKNEDSSDLELNSNVLKLRMCDAKYRLADANLVTQHEEADLLQRLKMALSTGQTQEAEKLLLECNRAAGDSTDLSVELLLETARLFSFKGEWIEALKTCSEALGFFEIPAITLLTLHQVRANAAYECGLFSLMMSDLEKVRTLKELFPKSQAAFYAVLLNLKFEAIANPTLDLMSKLDSVFNQNEMNFDFLLTYLRIKIEISRSLRLPTSRLALMSVWVADHLGDQLYLALAYLDCQVSESLNLREWARRKLTVNKNSYPRVVRLLAEISENRKSSESVGGEELSTSGTLSTTAKSILNYQAQLKSVATNFQLECPKVFVLLEPQLRVDFQRDSIEKLNLQARTLSILHSLKKGEIEKEHLFKQVWNCPTYRSEAHDELIRTALKRLRRQTGLKVVSRMGLLSLTDSTIV